MMIPVNNAGEVGVVSDRLPHELALNVWSAGRNVRTRNGSIEKILGHARIFGATTVAPYFLLEAWNATSRYWLYPGLSKVYVTDGTTHTNITRQTAGVDVNYNATAALNWTGGNIGGIPFLNNGVDTPQMWNPLSVGTKLAILSAWDANHICGAMRTFKRILIAMDVTKSGIRYPQMIKWSNIAQPGALPTTWDHTDTTQDAGQTELKETSGILIDGAPMGDAFVVYKDDSFYGCQYVGGSQVLKFTKIEGNLGILSRRCAVEVDRKHAVFAKGDIVLHDGLTVQSLVHKKMRDWIFRNIDPTFYQGSFVVRNRAMFEVWFCFPQTGSTLPNIALVWNYKDNTLGFKDLASVPHIEAGNIIAGLSDTWAAAVGDWSSDSQWWGEPGINASSPRLIMADPTNSFIQYADYTNQNDGSNMTSYIERTGLPFPVTKDGPPDMQSMKLITRLWPRIEGTLGGNINVYIGTQQEIGGSVTYGAAKPYTIGTTKQIPISDSPAARLHALKFESTTDIEWRLHGYEADVKMVGRY